MHLLTRCSNVSHHHHPDNRETGCTSSTYRSQCGYPYKDIYHRAWCEQVLCTLWASSAGTPHNRYNRYGDRRELRNPVRAMFGLWCGCNGLQRPVQVCCASVGPKLRYRQTPVESCKKKILIIIGWFSICNWCNQGPRRGKKLLLDLVVFDALRNPYYQG